VNQGRPAPHIGDPPKPIVFIYNGWVPEPLLQTKLFIPPLRLNLVPRPLLVERLSQGLAQNNKLTLVCAPAGFGKTTLISDWIQKHSKRDSLEGIEELSAASRDVVPLDIAWLSLDKEDNDPIRFLTYFTAALSQVIPGLDQEISVMLSSSQSAFVEPFISAIINHITAAGLSTSLVLILEDYHFIDSAAVHEGLIFLLEHLPPQMHLVITSRSDPPLLLSRLRARDQMMEIRARDLRFTYKEAAVFLGGTMGLDLSDEIVATLEQRTEGWIAGLQLAAMSLRQQDDPLSFVTTFAGDDRYVADYLMDEVIRQQPASIQDFLLGTSILDSLSAPLCDAVMEVENSRTTLKDLEAYNLFIVPLDNQRRWYRYHYLLADLLRQRLGETVPHSEVELLHQRASRWYEEEQLLVPAVEHALSAGDYQSAVRLIEQGAPRLFLDSRMNTLLKWWKELPQKIILTNPKLCLIYGWAWLSTSHPTESERCLQAIEQELGAKMAVLFDDLEKADQLDPAVMVALVEIAVIRGQLAILKGDIGEALELSRLALPYLDDPNQPFLHNAPEDLRTIVLFTMGLAYKLQGELSKASPALAEAMWLGHDRRNVHLVAVASGNLASVQAMQGHLHQAVHTCHHGLTMLQEMTGRLSPMSGRLHTELGAILYEQNDLEAAYQRLQEGISLAKPWGFMDALLPGYLGLARLRAAEADWVGALAALDELEELGRSHPGAVLPAVESHRARLWVAQGDIAAAGLWVEKSGLHIDAEFHYRQEDEYIILARVRMAQKRWDGATLLIDRLSEIMDSGERRGRLVELFVLKALALDAQDKPDEALEPLARALELAEPQRYVRIFVDEGESMARLLYQAVAHGIRPGYSKELLSAFQFSESAPFHESQHPDPRSGLIEPLSQRELEVLECLNSGLSNREIAQRLTIALTTVKTHTRNIYRKLDVSSRTQAVAKANALGIT